MPCCVFFSILPAAMKSVTAKIMFAPLTAFVRESRSSMSAGTISALASALFLRPVASFIAGYCLHLELIVASENLICDRTTLSEKEYNSTSLLQL